MSGENEIRVRLSTVVNVLKLGVGSLRKAPKCQDRTLNLEERVYGVNRDLETILTRHQIRSRGTEMYVSTAVNFSHLDILNESVEMIAD
jgi:hypothetical protein